MVQYHLKRLNKIILLSFVFVLINYAIFVNEEYMPNFMVLVPIITLVVLLVLTLNESQNFAENKPQFRVGFLIFCLIFILFGSVYASEDVEYLAGSISVLTMVFIAVNAVLCLRANAKLTKKNIEETNKASWINKNNVVVTTKEKGKYIPEGYYSKKDYSLSTFLIVLVSFIFIGLDVICVLSEMILLILFFFCLHFASLITIFFYRNKFINKPIFDFENNFDYEALNNYFTEVIDNPKIHPGTKNYCKLILANYKGLFSKEEQEEMLKDIIKPTSAAYRITYFNIMNLKNADDYEASIANLNKLLEDPLLQQAAFKNIINKEIRKLQCIFGKIDSNNIDKEFASKSKTTLSLIYQEVDKLRYYFYRNDKENNIVMYNKLESILNNIPNCPIKIENYKKYLL